MHKQTINPVTIAAAVAVAATCRLKVCITEKAGRELIKSYPNRTIFFYNHRVDLRMPGLTMWVDHVTVVKAESPAMPGTSDAHYPICQGFYVSHM